MPYINLKISFFTPLILALFASLILLSVESFIDSILLFFGLSLVSLYLLINCKKDLFNPMYLFSIFFLLVYISAMLISSRGLENNIFISSTYFYNDINTLYTWCLLICLISYSSAILGYHLISYKNVPIKPKPIPGIESPIFILISLSIYLLGISNFIYNVTYLYSGDFFTYFKNISIRKYDHAENITTLGYHLMYAATYMFFIRSLHLKKGYVFSSLLIAISALIFFSTGRISNTLFYMLSFLVIFYYNRGEHILNRKYFILGVCIVFIAIFLYSLRVASALYYNNLYDFSENSIGSYVLDFFSLDSLVFYTVEKGNIPNFAVLMKVVDSWGKDIGYSFGSTMLHPLYGYISSDLFGLIQMPAATAKEVWYSHIPGGNLPVTGMGEMILNFTVIGFPIGMFFFGTLGAAFKNIYIISRSNIYLIFYSKICFFFLLFPKGEFNNLNLFWNLIPCFIFLISIYTARTFSSLKQQST